MLPLPEEGLRAFQVAEQDAVRTFLREYLIDSQ